MMRASLERDERRGLTFVVCPSCSRKIAIKPEAGPLQWGGDWRDDPNRPGYVVWHRIRHRQRRMPMGTGPCGYWTHPAALVAVCQCGEDVDLG